eukprot:m.33075 g.33075  ORF g.33075 m.33075 type:complete len:78 (+) comp31753_c0_seq3:350-583(+)
MAQCAGYIFDFDPPLEASHRCPLCDFELREALQTSCGHRFCSACLNVLFRSSGSCGPTDHESLRDSEVRPVRVYMYV